MHLGPHRRVQGAERLVQEEDVGPRRQRPSERDPLLLPAREGFGAAVGERGQVDQLEEPAGVGACGPAPRTSDGEREGDVVQDVEVREQPGPLEDQRGAPVLGRHPTHRAPRDQDVSAVGRVQTGHETEHRVVSSHTVSLVRGTDSASPSTGGTAGVPPVASRAWWKWCG